jgi:hypothetical protein
MKLKSEIRESKSETNSNGQVREDRNGKRNMAPQLCYRQQLPFAGLEMKPIL